MGVSIFYKVEMDTKMGLMVENGHLVPDTDVKHETKKFKNKVKNFKVESSSYEPTWAHNLKEHIPVVHGTSE